MPSLPIDPKTTPVIEQSWLTQAQSPAANATPTANCIFFCRNTILKII